MAIDSQPRRSRRSAEPLTRERIIDAAVDLADGEGIDAVTMRRLGQRLGVEAMSLYKHVADKDEVLAGIADRVAGEFALPSRDVDWRTALRDELAGRPRGPAAATRGRAPSWSRRSSPVPRASPTSTPSSACSAAPGSRCPTSPTRSARSTATSTGSRCRSPAGRSTSTTTPRCRRDGRRARRRALPEPARDGDDGRHRAHGVPLEFTFGLDLLLDGLERRLRDAV